MYLSQVKYAMLCQSIRKSLDDITAKKPKNGILLFLCRFKKESAHGKIREYLLSSALS